MVEEPRDEAEQKRLQRHNARNDNGRVDLDQIPVRQIGAVEGEIRIILLLFLVEHDKTDDRDDADTSGWW